MSQAMTTLPLLHLPSRIFFCPLQRILSQILQIRHHPGCDAPGLVTLEDSTAANLGSEDSAMRISGFNQSSIASIQASSKQSLVDICHLDCVSYSRIAVNCIW